METKQIAIDLITADKSWNVRKYLGDDSDGGPDAHGFYDLMRSLEKDGQDTPLVVRPVSDGHYSLVAGFRRFEAMKRIYEKGGKVKGNKDKCVRAEIRNLSELQARCYNGRENTGRENLNAADTAFLIAGLAKEGLTDSAIATELALSDGYVGVLHRIYKGTSELSYQKKDGTIVSVFEHWREMPGRVPVPVMRDFASLRVNHTIKEMKYIELLKGFEEPNGNGAEKRLAAKRNEIGSAYSLGSMVGRLEKAGLISVKSQDWGEFLKVGKKIDIEGLDPKMGEQMFLKAREGYERGR